MKIIAILAILCITALFISGCSSSKTIVDDAPQKVTEQQVDEQLTQEVDSIVVDNADQEMELGELI